VVPSDEVDTGLRGEIISLNKAGLIPGISDITRGMLGADGIVGGGFSIAVGAALGTD
jgi:TPP-dependent pyruvate/acetoin dehydrogenase alpha subunit